MKITFPSQAVPIQTESGIDPTWYGILKQVEKSVNTAGSGNLATTATAGFAFLPTCAGPPTGVPAAMAGYVPCVFDTINNTLWIYNSTAWKGVVLT